VKLTVSDVCVEFHRVPALRDVGLEAAPRTITALIGPNGAGKSTLLRCAYGLVPYRGRILLDEMDARALGSRGLSHLAAYLPQDLHARSRLTVLEVVLLGKLGSLGWHVRDSDIAHARASLEAVGMALAADRPIIELSLGQRQLAFVAQALVRGPRLLLLDEPTSALDLRHQLELLVLIRRIVEERGATAVIALHDLNLASRFADRMVLLAHGQVHAAGAPVEVLTCETIRRAYGVDAEIHRRDDGVIAVTPLRALPGASTAIAVDAQ
jgi:iron complex transport system ATP-binding protein